MMKQAAIGVMTAVLTAVTLSAQAKPDFSGTWVMNVEKTAALNGGRTGGATMGPVSAGGGSMSASGSPPAGGNTMSVAGAAGARGPAAPLELAIAQTAATLTIERSGALPQKFVHKLDGTESTNVNGRATMKTKSHWQGGTLVTEGTNLIAGEDGTISVTLKEVRSLDQDGNLVIASTRTVDGNTNSSTQVFSKKK